MFANINKLTYLTSKKRNFLITIRKNTVHIMENQNIKEFIFRNNLKQVELAKYLDVTVPTMSKYVSGKYKLPYNQIKKLIDNPNGWDTSMLYPLIVPAEIISPAADNKTGIQDMEISKGDNSTPDTVIKTEKEDQVRVEVKIALLEAKVKELENALENEKKRADNYWSLIQTMVSSKG